MAGMVLQGEKFHDQVGAPLIVGTLSGKSNEDFDFKLDATERGQPLCSI